MPTDRIESMNHDARDARSRIDLAWATLTFAIVAISIQFSPNFGFRWAAALMASWGSLLMAGLVGGLRLYLEAEALRMNAGAEEHREIANKLIDSLRDPEFVQLLDSGAMPQRGSRVPISRETYMKDIKYNQEEHARVKKAWDRYSRFLTPALYTQLVLFTTGLILQAGYVSANLLAKVAE